MKKLLCGVLGFLGIIILGLILLGIFGKSIQEQINIPDNELINNYEVSLENNGFVFLRDFEEELKNIDFREGTDGIEEEKVNYYLEQTELLSEKNYDNAFSGIDFDVTTIGFRTINFITILREYLLENNNIESVEKLDYYSYELFYKLAHGETDFVAKNNYLIFLQKIYNNRLENAGEYQVQKNPLNDQEILETAVSFHLKKSKNYYEKNLFKVPLIFDPKDIFAAEKYDSKKFLETYEYGFFTPNYFYKNPVSVFFIRRFQSDYFSDMYNNLLKAIEDYNEM